MKIFIVDDDPNIVRVLKDIIINNNLGSVVGSSNDGEEALNEMMLYPPDIVLVDYLMPGIDGAMLVKKLLSEHPDISCIMISQVSNALMVTETYIAGIEFFIHKPINQIEVVNIIRSTVEKLDMKRQILKVQEIFGTSLKVETTPALDYPKQIQVTLSDLGILGEKGAHDILDICTECVKIKSEKPWDAMSEVLASKGKVLKQRMRRSINVGLKNISHLGIEDNLNSIFVKYSNTLFDFQEVYLEMEKLRGNSPTGGKINLTKFLENLLVQCKNN